MRIVEENVLKSVLNSVLAVFQISVDDIMSKSRTDEIVMPRQLAIALSYAFTGNTQAAIGYYYKGRDHATVNYSVSAVCENYTSNKEYKRMVKIIIKHINFDCVTSFDFDYVVRAANRQRNVAVLQNNLLVKFNEVLQGLLELNNKDEIFKKVRKLQEINGEIWSRQVQKEFKAQLKLEQDAKESQTN